MGHKFFKPKKIIINNPVIAIQKPIIKEAPTHYDNVVKVVNSILEKISINDNNLAIDDNLISKSLGKRQISNNEKYDLAKHQKLDFKEEQIKLFTDVYSINELVDYLNECSNSESSSSPLTDFEDIDDISDISIRDKFLQGSLEEVKLLLTNLFHLKTLLIEEKIHLELARKDEYYLKLELIMKMAARQGELLTEVIDLKNEELNVALTVALLNGNLQAFCFLLLKMKAKIPKYIYINGEKQCFLNYVAVNGKITKKKSQIEYLLFLVLNELSDSRDTETIFKHLTAIDSKMNTCLPHLLVSLYQSSGDLRKEINECIFLCLKMCPNIYEIQCISSFCPNFLFDLIAHCIILPLTNEDVLKELMKLQISSTEKQLYKNLSRVHRDPVMVKRLLEIIS